ncbi:hypothetical protein [Candidatus Phytoplasma sp. AldY-WA1]|uniref:hypothetical protein n=1 Tax=Candidatus Phytoplasma sp. AldY-WA1 TaxID=2852100 RepID=UPI00254BD58D|nr:hypothetical protein [Candidatus Phytoplasma sp. AldY-WA1]
MQKIENKINLKRLFFLFIPIILLISNNSLIFADKKLSDILTHRELGTIKTTGQQPTKDEVIAQVKNLNNSLKESNFLKIDNDPKENKAIVKYNNNDYTGEVEVTFTVEKKDKKLSDILTHRELGTIKTTGQQPTKDEVIAQVKNLNNSLKESNFLKIDNDPKENKAIVKYNNNDYTGEVEVTFTVEKKDKKLSDILTHRELGTIKTTGQQPTKDEVIAQVKKLNNSLKESNFLKIDNNPKENKAIVKYNNNDYTGEVEVTFTVEKKDKKLSDILTHRELGTIKTTGQQPTKDEVIAQVKNLNNSLKESNFLQIDNDPKENKAIVKYNNNDYTGEVEVTFTVEKKENINDNINKTSETVTESNKENTSFLKNKWLWMIIILIIIASIGFVFGNNKKFLDKNF